jgi:DNA gyrase inhibitor GyrI
MGMFSRVNIVTGDRGPYHIITLAQQGPYHQISLKIEQVSEMLSQNQVSHSIACAIFFDDPAKVSVDSLQSTGGFFVADSFAVDPPFIFQTIPKKKATVARIEANPAIAWFKTYPALEDWKNRNNYSLDSTQVILEIYYPDGWVEVEMPLLPAVK